MNEKKIGLLIPLAILLIGASVIVKDVITSTIDRNKYPILAECDTLSSIVIDKFNWEENGYRIAPDAVRFSIKNGHYYVCATDIESGEGAYYSIEIGDSLFKKASSDTLWVFKVNGDRSCLKLLEP